MESASLLRITLLLRWVSSPLGGFNGKSFLKGPTNPKSHFSRWANTLLRHQKSRTKQIRSIFTWALNGRHTLGQAGPFRSSAVYAHCQPPQTIWHRRSARIFKAVQRNCHPFPVARFRRLRETAGFFTRPCRMADLISSSSHLQKSANWDYAKSPFQR